MRGVSDLREGGREGGKLRTRDVIYMYTYTTEAHVHVHVCTCMYMYMYMYMYSLYVYMYIHVCTMDNEPMCTKEWENGSMAV